jgi:hypothetical protein
MALEQAITRTLPGSGTAANLGAAAVFGPITNRGARLTISARWTGTPTGSFALQFSDDGTTWASVPGASVEFTNNGQTQPAGGAGSAVWTWYGVPGSQVRLSYAYTSGTGVLTAYATQGE